MLCNGELLYEGNAGYPQLFCQAGADLLGIEVTGTLAAEDNVILFYPGADDLSQDEGSLGRIQIAERTVGYKIGLVGPTGEGIFDAFRSLGHTDSDGDGLASKVFFQPGGFLDGIAVILANLVIHGGEIQIAGRAAPDVGLIDDPFKTGNNGRHKLAPHPKKLGLVEQVLSGARSPR